MPYQQHDCFRDVESSTTIWHYMDFWKFDSLVTKQSLFFARLIDLKDRWEGLVPPGNFDPRHVASIVDEERAFLSTRTLDKSVQERFIMDIERDLASDAGGPKRQHSMAVNCWRIDDSEDQRCWSNYLNCRNGLAIRTTVGDLESCFQREDRVVHVGAISYIDRETGHTPSFNEFYPVLHKDYEFESEQELRAVVSEFGVSPDTSGPWRFSLKQGEFIRVDLLELIRMIVLSPFADNDFKSEVESLLRKNRLDFPIKLSDLRASGVATD